MNLRKPIEYAEQMCISRRPAAYTEEIKLLLNIIVTLDEFTLDNGATYLLSGSPPEEGETER